MPPRKGSPAELLLKKVHEKYLSLETYQDEGTVLSVSKYPEPRDDYVTHVKFRTMFKRPYFFLFEWTQDTGGEFGPNDCVWYDGEATYYFTDMEGPVLVRLPSLRHAFFPGWTRFAADFIQWMVWEGFRKYRLYECIESPKLSTKMDQDGVPCHVLFGKLWKDTDAKVYIGEEDLMVRRFERHRQNTQEDHEALVRDLSKDRSKETEQLLNSPKKYGITQKDLELYKKKLEPLKEPRSILPEHIDIETRCNVEINQEVSDQAFRYKLPADTKEVPLQEIPAYILSKIRDNLYKEFNEVRE